MCACACVCVRVSVWMHVCVYSLCNHHRQTAATSKPGITINGKQLCSVDAVLHKANWDF